MTNDNKLTSLPLAVRVYPEAKKDKQSSRSTRPWHRPDAMFVFDCETRIDATQALTFGSYRFIRRGRCLEEGIFYADDLPNRDQQVIKEYFTIHRADTVPESGQQLR